MTIRASLSQSAAHTFVFGILLGYTVFKIVAERDKRKKRLNGDNSSEEFPAPRRFGASIRLAPGKYRRYRELHDSIWEDVLKRMQSSNIRNFVIYYHEETQTLFQHFEWIGHFGKKYGHNRDEPPLSRVEEDRLFEADMLSILNDPMTRIWWKECEPCQVPFAQFTGPPRKSHVSV